MKPFQFKQFSIEHQSSAMKVGTDGVLLGAWADIKAAKSILDIGTGTGLLALMAAQRNSQAEITAIEIDPLASQEAMKNCASSPWQNRIQVIQEDVESFEPNAAFDHILCNPPFFEVNKNQTKSSRKLARQQVQFSLEMLFSFVQNHLNTNGLCSLIYPAIELSKIKNLLAQTELHLTRICTIYGKPNQPAVRILIELGLKKPEEIVEENLLIEHEERHNFTRAYRELTGEFYLKF